MSISEHTQSSTPGEVYGDFVEELEDQYDLMRSKFQRLLKVKNFVVATDTTFDSLFEVLGEESANYRDDFKKVFYDDEIKQAQELAHERIRKKKKAKERFLDLLYTYVKREVTWESVRSELSTHSSFNEIETEEDRLQIFNEHIEFLNYEESHDSSSGRDSDDDRKRHKRHKSVLKFLLNSMYFTQPHFFLKLLSVQNCAKYPKKRSTRNPTVLRLRLIWKKL